LRWVGVQMPPPPHRLTLQHTNGDGNFSALLASRLCVKCLWRVLRSVHPVFYENWICYSKIELFVYIITSPQHVVHNIMIYIIRVTFKVTHSEVRVGIRRICLLTIEIFSNSRNVYFIRRAPFMAHIACTNKSSVRHDV